MINAGKNYWARATVLLLAAAVLTGVAWNRGAEYDEQYTLFVTSGTPRPIWPETTLSASSVVALRSGHAGPATIARDLRRTDVHPPLYFWTVALWRPVAGDGLFAERLLSVVFGVGALAAVGAIARRCAIHPALAMLLTLGCYGFAYTSAIARGFALAHVLVLTAVLALLDRRRLLAGALFGAAVATNYLAVFVAGAVCLAAWRHWRRLAVGAAPGVLLAGWFFLAQHGTRTGQFPPFEFLHALARLARYWAANLSGGLPLYVPPAGVTWTTGGLGLGILALVAMVIRRWDGIAMPNVRLLLAGAAVAPPVGLMMLGLVFDNTPIELRYLSFGAPFAALLVAGARPPRLALAAILMVQAVSLGGLMTRLETMQPLAATARAAADLAGGGIVLLPRGNDGVGIVGAFAALVPPSTALLIVGPDTPASDIGERIARWRRVVLVDLTLDDASKAAVPTMRAALRDPAWREVSRGFNVVAYERVERGGSLAADAAPDWRP